MTDPRPYVHFRADLVGYLLTHDSTPAQVAGYLESDGRSSRAEIGNLRLSKDWCEANRRIVRRTITNTELPGDPIWTPDGWVRRDHKPAVAQPLTLDAASGETW